MSKIGLVNVMHILTDPNSHSYYVTFKNSTTLQARLNLSDDPPHSIGIGVRELGLGEADAVVPGVEHVVEALEERHAVDEVEA